MGKSQEDLWDFKQKEGLGKQSDGIRELQQLSVLELFVDLSRGLPTLNATAVTTEIQRFNLVQSSFIQISFTDKMSSINHLRDTE